jgi:hypothetical protein
MKCQRGISSICRQMKYVNTFCNLFTTILQLTQQIYSFVISFIHFNNEFCSYPLQLTIKDEMKIKDLVTNLQRGY